MEEEEEEEGAEVAGPGPSPRAPRGATRGAITKSVGQVVLAAVLVGRGLLLTGQCTFGSPSERNRGSS